MGMEGAFTCNVAYPWRSQNKNEHMLKNQHITCRADRNLPRAGIATKGRLKDSNFCFEMTSFDIDAT